ncbi:MAG: RES family NAD+ phosphorylase [Imperialibacter sp.]|uniref:RES family NAD+ phosphorylase n=1 Tax=Imperialibacter sp. TaxID=2038411 RepID=UPI003A8748F5
MEVFRLSRLKYISDLSGKGAAIKGARWNSIGTEIIYTASNRSLAMAEVAVHFSLATIPDDYYMLTIFIPDNTSIITLQVNDLPSRWNQFPHNKNTQKYGDDFVNANKHCLLKIPSVVTRGDHNILINPFHSEFSKIKITAREKFPFDERLFRP